MALAAAQRLGLEAKRATLGLNRHPVAAAMGLVVGRMVFPASELATPQWRHQRSGLGERLGYDFGSLDSNRLYRASDRLLAHREALEAHLYGQERDLFSRQETIPRYDLTNPFFEGTASANAKAQRGHSKEKRSECPGVTLARVLDTSGFPKRSEVFAGNVSEPKTLAPMVQRRAAAPGAPGPTGVIDAGLASEETIAWLRAQGDRDLAVSRERRQQFDPEQATLIRAEGRLRVQRQVNEASGEVRRDCHSAGREAKQRGIGHRFSTRLEAALRHLAEGRHRPRRVKRYEKGLPRIGRLRQRYSRVARYDDIRVEQAEASGNAKSLQGSRSTPPEDTRPGVYCLRTNQAQWNEATLGHTDPMLTALEAVFRSLKSEFGLRPVYHHKSRRVDGHLFISVLAYHRVHTLRVQLKAHGIHLSGESLRTQLAGQERVTVVLHRDDGQVYHIRKSTRPEPHQQILYNALGLPHLPGRTEKTLVDPRRAVSHM